ncbi:MAG: penicillin-binding transpeptidase domain-containing protein [Actinomycetes bacterium]
MNRGIRRVGIAVIGLLLVLVVQLTWLQVVDSHTLDHDPRNLRSVLRDINRPRGRIVTADGTVLARSRRVHDGTQFAYQREYPLAGLTAQAVGYQSYVVGNAGIERTYNDVLAGRTPELRSLGDLLQAKETTGTVVLAMRAAVQKVAAAALGDQQGSVVVLDVHTGGVVALYSNPTFDPQPLAGHDTKTVTDYFTLLNANPVHPSLARAFREIYPPGSTFKIVTSAVAFDAGTATPTTVYPTLGALTLPLTSNTLKNFGGSTCGGTVFESFVVSCNVTFGKMGLELGERFPPGLDGFGFGSAAAPLDVDPGAVRSTGLEGVDFRTDTPQYAYAGIGQGPVTATPLQMALVAQAVANGGVMLAPHAAAELRAVDGRVVKRFGPTPWKTSMTPATAQALTAMMRAVVDRGTGSRAQIAGVAVAGKTGTAQHDGGAPHAWFVGFAPADAPRYAVAVIVESGGSVGSEATGGAVAAPIAAAVLGAALAP